VRLFSASVQRVCAELAPPEGDAAFAPSVQRSILTFASVAALPHFVILLRWNFTNSRGLDAGRFG
jgi:hypothetical protein